MRALALLLALLLAGCGSEEASSSPRLSEPETVAVTALAPRSVGDRWRERVGAIDPPPPGAEDGRSEVAVVGYRVAGAPPLPSPADFDCGAVLLLPSDVQAACGPAWRWTGEEALDDACVHRFERARGGAGRAPDATGGRGPGGAGDPPVGGDGAADVLEIRVARRTSADAAHEALGRSLEAHGGEAVRLQDARAARGEAGLLVAFTEGRHHGAIQITGGCALDRAARLVPLLRSLVDASE
ncbi:MAG TPA: hypothetical protein RMH99_17770 [Sandaracinaceae bacterium LLY-WYZ-13_1]|nr:hypothetical protein [Sandaracinaceae bacterium LLY-WYZ-13_1]